jgi:hypothetical protein
VSRGLSGLPRSDVTVNIDAERKSERTNGTINSPIVIAPSIETAIAGIARTHSTPTRSFQTATPTITATKRTATDQKNKSGATPPVRPKMSSITGNGVATHPSGVVFRTDADDGDQEKDSCREHTKPRCEKPENSTVGNVVTYVVAVHHISSRF